MKRDSFLNGKESKKTIINDEELSIYFDWASTSECKRNKPELFQKNQLHSAGEQQLKSPVS
jgi:hypothetical protein